MTPDQWMALIAMLKWPVALVLGLAIFWRPIADLLRGFRNRALTYKDTQIGAEQQAQTTLPEPTPAPTPALPSTAKPSALPAPTTAAAKYLFEAEDNPYVTEIALSVRENVQSKTFASPEERDRWLYREGAKLEIRAEFERLYRTMFQSQLSILLAANDELNMGGVSNEVVVQAYQEAAKRHAEFYTTYPFESWMRYITSNGLLIQRETQWAITNKGQLYLHFLTATGYGRRANVAL